MATVEWLSDIAVGARRVNCVRRECQDNSAALFVPSLLWREVYILIGMYAKFSISISLTH